MYKIIRSGAILYRAAPTGERKPIPRMCSDTVKTGVYFCYKNPVISELMTLEKCEDLIVARYIVMNDMKVFKGKYYAATYLEKKYGDEFYNLYHHNNGIVNSKFYKDLNISHYDDEAVLPLCEFNDKWNKYLKAEVFLTSELLPNILYLDEYKFTVKDAVRKYVNE